MYNLKDRQYVVESKDPSSAIRGDTMPDVITEMITSDHMSNPVCSSVWLEDFGLPAPVRKSARYGTVTPGAVNPNVGYVPPCQ
jgi:hypothetical protein